MLSQAYPPEKLKDILIPRESWRPFPTADERDPWAALPEAIRKAHIARGENNLDFTWPVLPATLFLQYARMGNRNNYEHEGFGRRNALSGLVIAECMEGKGRFVDQIVNGIWAVCEETYWGIPAHVGVQKAGSGLPDAAEPTVDLFAAETSALMAWTYYLLRPQLDAVSPLIAPRIEREIQHRILTPLLERDDFGWMGFRGNRVNNWNPWICSNWLASALLIEQDEDRRTASVAKAMRTVDHFIDPYPKDGGCDEGPGYWGRAGASLYDCLEWLHSATDGAIDVYGDPLVQDIGRFIYRVQIADRYFINFADAPALVTPSPSLVFGYGKRIGDPKMMGLGAWSADRQNLRERGVHDSIGRQLPALFSLSDLLEADPVPPLPRDVWLHDIQVVVARDQEGASNGLFVAAKGGHNAESHNHNDVGNVVVYMDGKPVIVDAGVETYSRKTFSSERYTIWTMQSAYHTLPTVNGHMQMPGRIYKGDGIDYKYEIAAQNVGYRADDDAAEFTLDLAHVYPPEAGIVAWARTVTLNRGKDIVLTDAYDLKAVTGDLSLNMVTPCDVDAATPGTLVLKESPMADDRSSGAAHIHYDAEVLSADIETVPIEDGNLKRVWGERLIRIVLTAVNPQPKGSWTLRITK